jgi:hypothetical protein
MNTSWVESFWHYETEIAQNPKRLKRNRYATIVFPANANPRKDLSLYSGPICDRPQRWQLQNATQRIETFCRVIYLFATFGSVFYSVKPLQVARVFCVKTFFLSALFLRNDSDEEQPFLNSVNPCMRVKKSSLLSTTLKPRHEQLGM